MPTRVMYLTPELAATVPDLHRQRDPGARAARGRPRGLRDVAVGREDVRQPQVDRVSSPVGYATASADPLDHALVAAKEPQRYDDTSGFAQAPRSSPPAMRTPAPSGASNTPCSSPRARQRLAADGIRIGHLHAHFAHDPALVALLFQQLTGVTYSLTAHARDLYQIPPHNLRVRVAGASSVLTCCRANVEYLTEHLEPAEAAKVRVIHHGIDLEQFTPGRGATGDGVVGVVSVGRLVEKKGFPDLMQACAALGGDRPFRLTVYGDGPMREALEAERDALGWSRWSSSRASTTAPSSSRRCSGPTCSP